MKQSKLFTRTEKTVAENIKSISHKFLNQAGFIKESVSGRYFILPLGMRVRDKIVKIIEEEMNRCDALKIIAPVLHPIELWKETNRTESVGFELTTVKDRRGSEFALGGTAEEMMVDLVRKFNISYKDLPFNIYQFSQKFRDELRARGGLLRVREFLMKDAYSFHADKKDFQRGYCQMEDAYKNIFQKMGLETVVAESDNGYIGGDYCHEFIVENEAGESKFLISKDKKYVAHEDVAKFKKENKNLNEKEKKLKEVNAKRGKTMEDGVRLHNLPLWRQIKDVIFIDDKNRFILAVIRGDFDINETKLKNLVKANDLRHATDEEIRKLGSEPGFISPVRMNKKVTIIADDSLRTIRNAYGGANKKHKDLLNVNIDRDYKPEIEGDIALAKEGFSSESGEKLKEKKGVEVGNIFQLGHYYSKQMKATFTNKDGKEKFYYMGCYGIGVDRTLAAIAEVYHDDRGIIWPEAVAPFKVHLLSLGEKEEAEKLYNQSLKEDVEVLYDDRDISAGEKFADADLIGIPYRAVLSKKSLELGGIELKKRDSEKNEILNIEELLKKLRP